MLRRYDEPIEVRRSGEDPAAFIWRGRLYQVRAVLDRWQVRRSWWRAPLDHEALGPGTGASDVHPQGRSAAAEDRVWRVEASAGRVAGTGVYELSESAAAWLLVGAVD